MNLITLKELCEMLHISRRTIQCYEKEGLMAATGKNKYGHLLYDEKAVERAKTIKFFQDLGFKIKELGIIDASNDIKKEALENRVEELEQKKRKLEVIIEEARRLIEQININF